MFESEPCKSLGGPQQVRALDASGDCFAQFAANTMVIPASLESLKVRDHDEERFDAKWCWWHEYPEASMQRCYSANFRVWGSFGAT